MKTRVFCYAALLACLVLNAEEELSRTWTATSGKTLEATFWQVENGLVELKKADGELTGITIQNLSPEDINHIIRKGGGVWAPTVKRLAGNYVLDPQGAIVPRRPSDQRISGTISSIIGTTMLIVTNGPSNYIVECDTTGYEKNKQFSAWGRAGDSTMVLPDGTSGKVYIAYTALDDSDQTGRRVLKDPLRFSNYFTGKSAACKAQEGAQSLLEKVVSQEARKTAAGQEQRAKRKEAEQGRTNDRQEAKNSKLEAKLKEDIGNYERQIKTLESNIRSWEAKKRNSKMHSKVYNSMRSRIGEAELKVQKLQRSIRDAKAELLKL